jgi:hypothetical protein
VGKKVRSGKNILKKEEKKSRGNVTEERRVSLFYSLTHSLTHTFARWLDFAAVIALIRRQCERVKPSKEGRFSQ